MENKEIYPQILKDNIAELPYFRGFLRAVEGRYYQAIEMKQPVLDMGAGDGHFAARTFKQKIYAGIDPAFVSLEEANGFGAYEHLFNGMGDRIPFKADSFATVVSNSVLEHIPDVDAVLVDIQRVLLPKGHLVITVPNSNFTEFLSIARFFDSVGLKFAARWYRRLFNKISRHYHPDDADVWRKRLEDAGFDIIEQWNYFPPESLRKLEWGHYFGLPNWINKKLFGKWVLFPDFWYACMIYNWLLRHYAKDQKSTDGAYTFFIAEKTNK